MSTRDVKKTEVQRSYSDKRAKNRKKRLSFFLYSILIIALIIILVIVLCSTVLFNIDKFDVSHIEGYSKEDIVKASDIQNKDNLFLLDTKKAEENIIDNLTFIETAKVKKVFPNTLKIEVTPCKQAYNVEMADGNLIVSEKGKILSKEDKSSELVTYKGYDTINKEPGMILQSSDPQKDKIFEATSKLLEKGLKYPIDTIDMTDKYSIKVEIDGRIIFDAGSWNDMDYKINLAETCMNQIDSSERGFMNMVGGNQISYRNEKDVEESKRKSNTNVINEETSSSENIENNNNN